MRIIKKSNKKIVVPVADTLLASSVPNKERQDKKVKNNTTQDKTIIKTEKKITFACNAYLLEKVKKILLAKQSQGNYQYINCSQVIRQALEAYQKGMALTAQRQINNPKKEISFRLSGELLIFYESLTSFTKTAILERALASYYEKFLV
jgi:hypothetical protein